ncbi:hypothetical protein SCHPADRAFT_898736 [Schizopora paradoxa]|uniref:Autophagy-related protein 27 n=1 Tax=Schizopora paradoxa TaxID=27342 RepID=A0A0H2SQW7_9AGAM|nr:hypothetical protein SCHPADRAFT_898736 [Schizopora paradoxa]
MLPKRYRFATSALLVLSLLAGEGQLTQVYAQSEFDCRISLDGGKRKYDLTSLAGEHTLSRTRDTPPSVIVDELRFNLCGDLEMKQGVEDQDQCPSGTRACLTMTNQKSSESDRVIAVIPLAISSSLSPEITPLSSPKGLKLILHGSSYPVTEPQPQSLSVTLLCDTTPSDPTFVSYSGSDLQLEWKAPAGCSFSGEEETPGGDSGDKEGGGEGKDGKGEESVGSGIGWFFLLLLIAFGAYFLLGAYYNYSTYGATGADLIPHRDFWRDVPYVLRDVAAHLCSTIRPNRSGYIAV